MHLRLFKTLFQAVMVLVSLYWATVFILDYGPRLAVDGVVLLAEDMQQLLVLIPLYLAGMTWLILAWRDIRAGIKTRAIEAQRHLKNKTPSSASELRLREQFKQWKLQARVEGTRPTFLLLDLSQTAQPHNILGLVDVAETSADEHASVVDLEIVQVGRFSVLRINAQMISPSPTEGARLWQYMLDELKSLRGRRCSLVGGVLVISASSLQALGESPDLVASNLRERLEELARSIGKGLPIQAIITHCECLPGYAPSIMGLPVEERDLRIDFPLVANPLNIMRLAECIGNRLERLDDTLLDRLQMEPLTLLRTQLYGFAQLWRQFSVRVQLFFQTVFHSQVRLQSLRFSAGALSEGQKGIATSELLLRTLQQCERHGALQTPLRRAEGWLRSHTSYWFAALVIFLSLLLINGYRHHSRALEQVLEHQKLLSEIPYGSTNVSGNNWQLQRLDILADAVEVARQRWGPASVFLYEYRRLMEQVEGLYEQALKETFTPLVVSRLEKSMNEPQADLYDCLRLYLMLGGHGNPDPVFLRQWVRTVLEQELPHGLLGLRWEHLDVHLQGIVLILQSSTVLQVNQTLVEQVRAQIALEQPALRMYRQLSAELQNPAKRELSVVSEARSEGVLMLASRSGLPLTRGVPWLFSHEGYQQLSQRLPSVIADGLRDEEWVMGIHSQADPIYARDQVLNMYLRDYIVHWERFIGDIKFSALDESESLPDRLEILSREDSVLRTLLEMINRQTDWSLIAHESGLLDRLREQGSVFAASLNINTPLAADVEMQRNLVTSHFASFHQMTLSMDGRPSLLDQLREALNYLGTYLSARERAIANGLSGPEENALDNMRSLTDQLPRLIRPLMVDILKAADTSISDRQTKTLFNNWAQSLEPYCQRVTVQRYPFDRDSKEDVPILDFNRLFAPSGLLQAFYRSFREKSIDDGIKLPISVTNDHSNNLGTDLLWKAQFERAEHIGNGFFPTGSNQARIDFELSPVTMDEDIASFRVSFDDQHLNYSHGPISPLPFSWPAKGLSSRLRISVTLFDGRILQQSEEGVWAWFRILDRGVLRQGPSADTQWLNLTFEGHKVVLQIRNISVEQPFGDRTLSEFRCPH